MSDFVQFLGTERIGQLTGSTDPRTWPLLVDVEQRPLLTDTGRWGVTGVDLGATAEHQGRLYIFFGDVATSAASGIPLNADLVAWTDETQVLRHGGHLGLGLTFVLPFEPTAIPGQPEWRFCGKCGVLFWDGDPNFKGVCHRGGTHSAIGFRFVLPFEPTDIAGQPEWRFCGKCGSLFWNGDPNFKGACPQGGPHSAIGFRFVLPFEPTGLPGQHEWRFCGKCADLFWNGDAHKGVCAGAPGGGVHLNGVLNANGFFDPFAGTPPVGLTLSLETPNGAFSYSGKVYVFAGIAPFRYSGQTRSGDPALGCYLVSKDRPDLPGVYQKEFLFSPRIGWCPHDASREKLESHEPLGFQFLIAHDIAETATLQANYRFCGKCATLISANDPALPGRCHRGGSHEPAGFNYLLKHSVNEDPQQQADWRACAKCTSVFWNGEPANTGLCPAGGGHQPTGPNLLVTHPSLEEDGTHQANWRFCGKCGGLFWDGDFAFKGVCPQGSTHEAIGFNFMLPHDINEDAHNQKNWRFCGKCGGLFWDGDPAFRGLCAKGNTHEAIGFNFVLPHDTSESLEHQANWRFCGKCGGLFWDGDPAFKGVCPGGGTHAAIGFNFVLPHNPGEDRFRQGGWRFCVRCRGLVWTRQEDLFPWVAPWVVRNVEHPSLPETPHELGLVIFGFGYASNPGIRLAWMPLKVDVPPTLQDLVYFTGNAANRWSPNAREAVVILPHTNTYTHLSTAWLEGPRRWILLYANANDETGPNGYPLPIVAHIGTSLFDWSSEIEIFNPIREQAYGRYMHKVGQDRFNVDAPPPQDPSKPEHDGWAYGAFLLNRYTEWNVATRELDIFYLLSLSSPYQVQLMHTRLRL